MVALSPFTITVPGQPPLPLANPLPRKPLPLPLKPLPPLHPPWPLYPPLGPDPLPPLGGRGTSPGGGGRP